MLYLAEKRKFRRHGFEKGQYVIVLQLIFETSRELFGKIRVLFETFQKQVISAVI